MNAIRAADLLIGSDHDFLVNLYLAALGRWPDEEGYSHFRDIIAEGQAGRVRALHIISGSPEAQKLGRRVVIDDPLVPSEPDKALATQLSLRTEFLHRQIGAAPAHPAPVQITQPLVRELRSELTALRQEMRERLAQLSAEITPRPLPPMGDPSRMADQLHEALALAEARMELRIRALEKRLP